MFSQTMSAATIIEKLQLLPHPEGGFYSETYRCSEEIPAEALDSRYGSARSICTSIYFLLTRDVFSSMHRVASDEIYHFYCGSPLEMLLLNPDGTHEIVVIGSDLSAGQRPQFMIPRGVWQGSRVMGTEDFALVGATVAPGFDFRDFELGDRAQLIEQYPAQAKLITTLTRV